MLLSVGDQAPKFKLKNQEGNLVSLDLLKGKIVILWFYPKASTPGWIVEGQGFRDELKKFSNLNCIIIGASADSIKKQKNFCSNQSFNFDLLSDESHEMLENYGVWGKKKFMGREYMGISRVTYIIDVDGTIKKIYDKVNTKTHAQDILNDL